MHNVEKNVNSGYNFLVVTKRTKRAIFYVAVVIFLFASFIVVLYAKGYKYSFGDARFYRTGSVHVKANVGAKVYLDDKLEGATSFLGNSKTLNGLLPGEYSIRLARDDQYSSWEKKFVIEEGFVNEFSKIVLFPLAGEEKERLEEELELLLYPPPPAGGLSPSPSPSVSPIKTLKPTPKTTASPSPSPNPEPYYLKSNILYKNNGLESDPTQLAVNVSGFALSSNGNKLAYWTGRELWVTWFNDTNYQPLRKAGDKERIIRLARPVGKALWYKDTDWLVVDDGKNFKVLETDTRGGVNVVEF